MTVFLVFLLLYILDQTVSLRHKEKTGLKRHITTTGGIYMVLRAIVWLIHIVMYINLS